MHSIVMGGHELHHNCNSGNLRWVKLTIFFLAVNIALFFMSIIGGQVHAWKRLLNHNILYYNIIFQKLGRMSIILYTISWLL